jgi:hypothetical protein
MKVRYDVVSVIRELIVILYLGVTQLSLGEKAILTCTPDYVCALLK